MQPDKIARICREDCRLTGDETILVGVSGGADSLALLDVLQRLNFRVVAAHFNHQFRAEAAADAEYVRKIAEDRQIPFVTASMNVPALAQSEKLSLEEAGRAARYRFLFEQARSCNAQAVAVGHTADDQVETVLMHLLRGSGLAGLKGMQLRAVLPEWDAHLPLVRPLLGVWREETVAYCAEQGLTPLEDASNQNVTFFRNRLRHELIPYLQAYNPQIKAGLWRMSQTLAGDFVVLERALDDAWQTCVAEDLPERVALWVEMFAGLERGLQRGVMRRAIGRLRPHLRDVDFETIERALDFAAAPGSAGQIDLVQGLRLAAARGKLILAAWGQSELSQNDLPRAMADSPGVLAAPGELALLGGWRISAEVLSRPDLPLESGWMDDRSEAWLDADALTLPLTVRTRRPGDRFQPLGMDGHSLKLSDFWVNARLEKTARAAWPLVFSGAVLAWVPFFRPAHPFRVREETTRVVWLKIEKTG